MGVEMEVEVCVWDGDGDGGGLQHNTTLNPLLTGRGSAESSSAAGGTRSETYRSF